MAGRHTKLTREMIDKIYDGFSQGLTVSAVCALNRIGYSTFYDWKQQGDKPEATGLLKLFSEKVDAGLAEAEKRWVSQVETEQGGAKWLLAHRLRKDWGDKLEIEHTGSVEFVVSWDDSNEDEE